MKFVKTLVVIVCSLFLCFVVSCATIPPPTLESRMSFPTLEYLLLAKSGSAIVKGQAFLRTRGGDVKVAAGEVILNPVTSYSEEWYEKGYIQGRYLGQPDQRIWEYTMTTIADGDGRFVFKNVPPGQYFVTTTVTWEAPTGRQFTLQIQGGLVTKRITVNDEDEINIVITR